MVYNFLETIMENLEGQEIIGLLWTLLISSPCKISLFFCQQSDCFLFTHFVYYFSMLQLVIYILGANIKLTSAGKIGDWGKTEHVSFNTASR